MKSLTDRFEQEVFNPYLDLLKSEYRFHPQFAYAERTWHEKLTMAELVHGAFLEKSQMYKIGVSLENLPLHEKTKATIHERLKGRNLYQHQTDALQLILNGQNAVIATGTSSGKTLCYQIPILDDLLHDSSPGLRAIIIYPLNALVNDQLEEWETMLKKHQHITFARFTGQTPNNQQDYESRLKQTFETQLREQGLMQNELQREVNRKLNEQLRNDPSNRLNHRDDIRANPPHILITNFSMLEYLMERPVDAPIFENARLRFLVLDEVHAYRGVQATEIAFLVRRLKDRLGLEQLSCIATSATLGNPNEEDSKRRVRAFASALFGEEFIEPNPIYGTPAPPLLLQPSVCPTPGQYIKAAEILQQNKEADVRTVLSHNHVAKTLADLFNYDENLYRLRAEILTKPTLLKDAAKSLWGGNKQAEDGLQALLEIVAAAKQDDAHEDLLPTRLHYFVRAQDGLHVCLHRNCPGRSSNDKPAFFVSRKSDDSDIPEGLCPKCYPAQRSQLVEVVSCRKCGYLFGALQDLGPRRAQNPDNDEQIQKPAFDSFSTELGWASDSFWSYFSVEDDLPYPIQAKADEEDEEQDKLLVNPASLEWCVVCGKKSDSGEGDNCSCEAPHLRPIKIFHRQCAAERFQDIYSQQKKLLAACPNCGARNGSGIEPVRRFQESDDETGLAMAIPLSHFQVSQPKTKGKPPRKLLCFTDHRQRAAAFPSLLEEETFAHDMGRKIVKLIHNRNEPLTVSDLGELLAEIAEERNSDIHDPEFFLPVSRYTDENPSAKEKGNLWIAETLSYFGILDSARESAEDLGLVAIKYEVKETEMKAFQSLLPELSLVEAKAVLQTLLGFMRQRKAFTLPNGVAHDAPAFGRVTADISYALRREGQKITNGWLPLLKKDGSYNDNFITDYLRRLFGQSDAETLKLAEEVWTFLTKHDLLIINKKGTGRYRLDHERLAVVKNTARYICNRCGMVTAYAAKQCCPRKACSGKLEERPFDATQANIIARWVAGTGEPQFTTLKSEEHTAQINKDLAKKIEDDFRAEGVNLLSSTTTFEMGINIGDLQKVLLRNAPPSSASYVQRVGRAGRGQDKNAVCVTLCRRSKYDADMWREPQRLMSGEVRTPTVFIENRVIAQRHFNAVVFARFLRVKILNEKALRDVKQKIRLAAFLPTDSRVGIPQDWLQLYPSDLHLDFIAWLETQSVADIFCSPAGQSLLGAIDGFELGKEKSKETYKEVLSNIADELSELMSERKKFFNEGKETGDIDRSVKNLLDSDIVAVMAKRGFLPRYAFPLDTVTLETGWSRWSSDSDVELNRDRAIAISEFAPGAQVIAHKKVFTSSGLYVVSRTDKPERWWYSKCPECLQIRTSRTQDPLITSCEVCGRSITTQHIKPFVEPATFSVRIEKSNVNAARHRRASLVRQRQSLTHFIDSVNDDEFEDRGAFKIALKTSGSLFRYNLGPQNKGFMLCAHCGCSEPLHFFKAGKKHRKLRPMQGSLDCSNETPWTKPLAYGHQFQSFCLIARPIEPKPPIESLAYALQKGLCEMLEIETSDIGVAWRWLANRNIADAKAEIILFDNTPGGAGFVKEGFDNWQQTVASAQKVCEKCKCEVACYDCLKNFSNQTHHDKLSRHRVIEFFE
ncbi:MAG: DEAD/DEAH box helicase [Acidobacteriota bacterium]